MSCNILHKRPGHVVLNDGVTLNDEHYKPNPGASFSALINSMLPQLDDVKQNLESNDYVYDEFGFKISADDNSQDETDNNNNGGDGDGMEECVKKKKNHFTKPFIEDSKHKLKWIAYLEFNLNKEINENFSFKNVRSLEKCEKLKNLIRSQGIPHSLRPYVWLRLSGAYEKKAKSTFTYNDLLKKSQNDTYHTSKQIEKDLLRTMPTNICFKDANSVGIPRMRRILQSIAWLYPNIGYCQGMGPVVGTLLLFLEEEDAFWLISTIIENILPASYYSHTLIGVQADIKVLEQLISTYLPQVDNFFKQHDIEISLLAINWFLTLFSNNMHIRILLRIWDLLYYDGSIVLFQLTLAMIKLNEESILKCENSTYIYNILNEMPSDTDDINKLFEISIQQCSSITQNFIDTLRRKHQAYFMAQTNSLINANNYKNIPLLKEKPQLLRINFKNKNFFKRFKTFVNQTVTDDVSARDEISGGCSGNCDASKMKNILQTETLLGLREIIIKIARHFQQYDANKYKNCELNADYSIESHTNDYAVFDSMNVKIESYKRAKALIDFERIDTDELSFRKNDIIKILSIKDEHCWIGQLDGNGERGWFPAKFVQLIDERNGKEYSSAGDDGVNECVRDLIRGEFCLVLKQIFEYGLKKWNLLGGTNGNFMGNRSSSSNLLLHPWSFIEQATRKIIEKDINSVYSRLILCETYRLDDDNNKILTPEELLYNCVKKINRSHDKYKLQMDVKFRSFVCMALNEQVLHIWLEILCSNIEIIEKFFEKWSFLRSPAWVQIKCELRLLAQFSFNLNIDAELPVNKNDLIVNESIKDMLIKHHLFSWDIN